MVRAADEAGHAVAGVSFSAAMHSLVGLDAAGRAAHPARDLGRRAGGAAGGEPALRDRGLALHRRTGTPVHPMSPLVKLRWFAEEEPETASAVRHWAGIKELVLRRLTGELVVDHGLASGTGLFDISVTSTGTPRPSTTPASAATACRSSCPPCTGCALTADGGRAPRPAPARRRS